MNLSATSPKAEISEVKDSSNIEPVSWIKDQRERSINIRDDICEQMWAKHFQPEISEVLTRNPLAAHAAVSISWSLDTEDLKGQYESESFWEQLSRYYLTRYGLKLVSWNGWDDAVRIVKIILKPSLPDQLVCLKTDPSNPITAKDVGEALNSILQVVQSWNATSVSASEAFDMCQHALRLQEALLGMTKPKS